MQLTNSLEGKKRRLEHANRLRGSVREQKVALHADLDVDANLTCVRPTRVKLLLVMDGVGQQASCNEF